MLQKTCLLLIHLQLLHTIIPATKYFIRIDLFFSEWPKYLLLLLWPMYFRAFFVIHWNFCRRLFLYLTLILAILSRIMNSTFWGKKRVISFLIQIRSPDLCAVSCLNVKSQVDSSLLLTLDFVNKPKNQLQMYFWSAPKY